MCAITEGLIELYLGELYKYTSPAQIVLNQLTSVRNPMIVSECHRPLYMGFLNRQLYL